MELCERNGWTDAYYRITITRGKGQIGFQRDMDNDLTCLIVGREFQGLDESYYRQGIALQVAQTRRNAPEAINPKIKSISNLNSLLGKLEAKAAGAFEVIRSISVKVQPPIFFGPGISGFLPQRPQRDCWKG